MAVLDSILIPGAERGVHLNDIAATTASALQTVGKNFIFTIVCVQAVTIRFGGGTADATDYLIPANTPHTFDLGERYTSFSVFNTAGTTTDVHYLRLSQF